MTKDELGGNIKTEIKPGVWLETHSPIVERARGSEDPAVKGQALLLASLSPSAAVIAAVLEAGADPNYVEPANGPALVNLAFHGAASGGEFVEMLLAAGADPRGKSSGGDEPLHAACKNNSLEAAKRLLGAGVDPNAVGEGGLDPLSLALGSGFDPMRRNYPGIRLALLQELFDAGAEVRKSHLELLEEMMSADAGVFDKSTGARRSSWLSDRAKAAAEMVRRQLEAAEIYEATGAPAPKRRPSI